MAGTSLIAIMTVGLCSIAGAQQAPLPPLTPAAKFGLAAAGTFAPGSFLLGGVTAGIAQLNDSDPSYGQGPKAYAKRYAAGFADRGVASFMTEAVMPAILHTDPRYFRKGSGPGRTRVSYALTRVLVAKSDSGRSVFNTAEFLGNGAVAAIGNLYHPDARGLSPTMQRMFSQIGGDALSFLIREFLPDLKQKYLNRKHRKQ